MRYVLLITLLASCSKKPITEPQAPTATAEAPTSVSFHEAMRGNLAAISDAHVSIIRGDLGGIKEATEKLSKFPKVDSFPEPLLDMQVELMKAAGHASRSENLHQASERVVAITARCAACHTAAGSGPTFYRVEGPDSEASLKDRMRNHAWGADMMWKGLVAADEELVRRGAIRLAEGVLPPQDEAKFPEEVLTIESLLLEDAAKAADSTSLDEQRVLLGKILPRCGTCHLASHVQPEIVFDPTLK
jgi:cytochrome c553